MAGNAASKREAKKLAKQQARDEKAQRKLDAHEAKIQAKEQAKLSKKQAKQAKRATRRIRRRKVLIIVGSTLVVLIAAGALIYPTAREYYTTMRENDRLQAEYDAVSARNAQIQGNIDNLNTDEGIEDQAREYGYIMDGENAVSVTNTGEITTPTSVPADVDERDVKAPDTWWSVMLDPFFGVD